LLPYPELAYLTHSNANSTPNNYDKQKDPLGLIEKIIDSVENFAASVNDDEKNNALSLSLILAIKTGKLRYHNNYHYY
jgi:predicted secreted protein